MLFNSISFLIFFPLVTLAYFLFPARWRWTILLAASIFFYMAFVPVYILILGALILIDYWAGLKIEKASQPKKKKIFLIASLISTGAVLFVFKYFNFFADNVNALAKFIGWNYSLDLLKIALPLGLSFHTFQSLSYVIEVYRNRQKAEKHLGIYALYVMFYPQLVAGPIERPQHLLPQLKNEHHFNYEQTTKGLKRMLWGMFKKVVIADRMAFFVGAAFGQLTAFSGVSLMAAAVYFAIQIYCDFSGYVDIAIGSAKIMGIKLTENFDQPYLSHSVSEFWRRWHISLSNWLRDYIFTPLALQARSWKIWGMAISALVTFAIAGIWHGANWTFLVFGILHGLAISGELLTRGLREKIAKVIGHFFSNMIGLIYTFAFWCFSLIFFRAQSLKEAFYISSHLFKGVFDYLIKLLHYTGTTSSGLLVPFLLNQHREDFLMAIFSIIILFTVEFFGHKIKISRWPAWLRWGSYYLLIFVILFYGVFNNTPFIYFRF